VPSEERAAASPGPGRTGVRTLGAPGEHGLDATSVAFRPVRAGNAFEETVERLLNAVKLGLPSARSSRRARRASPRHDAPRRVRERPQAPCHGEHIEHELAVLD